MAFDPFVQAVQKKLINKGYSVGVHGADGFAGDDTHKALLQFQKDRSLKTSGLATQETWLALDTAGERKAEIEAARDTKPTSTSPEWNSLPDVPHTWPRQADVERVFGPAGGPQCTAGKVALPYPMRLAWDLSSAVNRISCHEKVAASAQRVFERIANAYTQDERADLGIDLFGGCFNNRNMRGGTKKSMHAYGIAMDFDPTRNQLKWDHTRARLAKPDAVTFFKLWQEEGWIGLGPARDFDWMHLQSARL